MDRPSMYLKCLDMTGFYILHYMFVIFVEYFQPSDLVQDDHSTQDILAPYTTQQNRNQRESTKYNHVTNFRHQASPRNG